jgi:hypothetical protein
MRILENWTMLADRKPCYPSDNVLTFGVVANLRCESLRCGGSDPCTTHVAQNTERSPPHHGNAIARSRQKRRSCRSNAVVSEMRYHLIDNCYYVP